MTTAAAPAIEPEPEPEPTAPEPEPAPISTTVVKAKLTAGGAVSKDDFAEALVKQLGGDVKISDIKVTSYKIEAKAKASGIACSAGGKFEQKAKDQFIKGVANVTKTKVEDVTITTVAECTSRRRLTGDELTGDVGKTHRRRLATTRTTIDYVVSTEDASVGASMAKNMNNPVAFAKLLVDGVNAAGTALTLDPSDVITPKPEVETEIKYEVMVKDSDAAKAVGKVTGDATKMTTVANDAAVDGTPKIDMVKAENDQEAEKPVAPVAPVASATAAAESGGSGAVIGIVVAVIVIGVAAAFFFLNKKKSVAPIKSYRAGEDSPTANKTPV
jgi:hypothetical protein